MPITKYCPSCETDKDSYLFNRSKIRYDGLSVYCRECLKIKYTEKRDERLKQKHEYYLNNKEQINKKHKAYNNSRRKKDVGYRILCCLRTRICSSVKNNSKSKKTKELLGCSMDDFKNYLEKQFDSNMSWENYGSYWHIDHIKPCAAFDLSNDKEQKKCFNYTNLRPLSAIDNWHKAGIYNE